MTVGDEKWVTIPQCPNYEASSLGRIMNKSTGNILKPSITASGYERLSIFVNKKPKNFRVHKLICLAFLGPDKGLYCNHKDGNKRNNKIENLEYVTPRENQSHYSKYKMIGAHWRKETKSWYSSVRLDGKSVCLGHYDTQEDAHRAYCNVLRFMGIENKYADKRRA